MTETPRQGEVWFVDLSPVIGREQRGRRPVLILSNDDNNEVAEVYTVAPFTSSMTMRHHPATIIVTREDSGLQKDSLLLVFQLRSVDRSRLSHRLSALAPDAFMDVLDVVADHFSP